MVVLLKIFCTFNRTHCKVSFIEYYFSHVFEVNEETHHCNFFFFQLSDEANLRDSRMSAKLIWSFKVLQAPASVQVPPTSVSNWRD